MTYDIQHNEEASQFETTVDGQVAYAAYDLEDPDRIVFTHTIVPDPISGRGVASQLVQRGLNHARDHNLKVVPQCSFVATYIKRHSEYQDLLAQR